MTSTIVAAREQPHTIGISRRQVLAGLCATTALQSLSCATTSFSMPAPAPRERSGEVGLTWLGTASVLLELGALRLLTDPAFDPAGTTYDFGPWYAPASWFASQKTYDIDDDGVPRLLDAVLATHDQHADNLDYAARELLLDDGVRRVVTTSAGAARLSAPLERDAEGRSPPLSGLGIGEKVTGLGWGQSTVVGSGADEVRVTATPAKHGPDGTPYVREACGFVLEPTSGPTVWISGDTVLFPELEQFLSSWRGAIDLAIVHCGAVRFPDVPVLGAELFTFDGAMAVEAMELLQPRLVVPVHHAGWSHFQQQTDALRGVLRGSSIGSRVLWLDLLHRTAVRPGGGR